MWGKKFIWCGSALWIALITVTTLPLSAAEAVIDCRTRFNPTEDKPQSKLWQAHGHWWAWLPYESFGGRVWKRDGSGWSAVNSLDSLTGNLTGRADIWSNGDTVMAALVQGKSLAVASLVWSANDGGYIPGGEPLQWQADASEVETVTLERASNGQFVISYPDSGQIVAAVVKAGNKLQSVDKRVICESTNPDDISLTTRLGDNGPLCVIWSDQDRETLFYREFTPADTNDPGWGETGIIAAGNLTADDHLNACVPPDNPEYPRLIVASKTSLDTKGEPLLALRVLDRQGNWTTVDFAILTEELHPSRPQIFWWNDRPVCLYTCYGQSGEGNYIYLKYFSADGLKEDGEERPILGPIDVLNDVTGTKDRVEGDSLLILASDIRGKVYEILLER